MIKWYFVLSVLMLVGGCATVGPGAYRPDGGKEKAAFTAADKAISLAAVRADFEGLEDKELAWAGIIKDIRFKELPSVIQVAFQIEHRIFDWAEHGGNKPFHLSPQGDGEFVAGWTVRKPTSIGKLKMLAPPGSMILVYGKPYQMKDGVVQLSATALRIIKEKEFEVLDESGSTVPVSGE